MNISDCKALKNQTMVLVILGLVLIQSITANAYIPELGFILKKSSQTNGKKIMRIEQELTFKVGDDEAKIDETWLVEGDKNLKVSAVGKNLYKENIKLNYLYNGKTRTFMSGKNKNVSQVTSDFYQRYLFIRSKDSFLGYLKDLNISNDVRLSRADGVISFAIGLPSDKVLNPQFWISQDDFILRKIRTSTSAEISLSQIANLSNDVSVAKVQNISWLSLTTNLNVSVQIKIKKVDLAAVGNISNFYPQNIESPSEITFANKTLLTQVIEDFYSRFR
jgi:hypothetical protein